MTLNYLSSIVVDPTKLTKKYLDEISSPLSPEDGWIIFAVLLHQASRKFSSDAHFSLRSLNCKDVFYANQNVYDWLILQRRKRKQVFETLENLGLCILVYRGFQGTTFNISLEFYDQVKSMDVMTLHQFLMPTITFAPICMPLRSLSNDSTDRDTDISSESLDYK